MLLEIADLALLPHFAVVETDVTELANCKKTCLRIGLPASTLPLSPGAYLHSAARVIFLRGVWPCHTSRESSLWPLLQLQSKLNFPGLCAWCGQVPATFLMGMLFSHICRLFVCHSVTTLKTPPQGCPPWPNVQGWCMTLSLSFPSPWWEAIIAWTTIHIMLLMCLFFFMICVHFLQGSWDLPLL